MLEVGRRCVSEILCERRDAFDTVEGGTELGVGIVTSTVVLNLLLRPCLCFIKSVALLGEGGAVNRNDGEVHLAPHFPLHLFGCFDWTGRIAHPRFTCGYALGDDCPCADGRTASDSDTGNDGRIGSDGSALTNVGLGLFPLTLSLRVAVVREADVWPDEDVVAEHHAVGDESERLHLAVVADHHTLANPDVAVERTVVPQHCVGVDVLRLWEVSLVHNSSVKNLFGLIAKHIC